MTDLEKIELAIREVSAKMLSQTMVDAGIILAFDMLADEIANSERERIDATRNQS